MVAQSPFVVVFDPLVRQHLRANAPKYHSLIRDTIYKQLTYEPDVETRNRKPLEQPAAFGARWELRFGPDNWFRVLYSVNREELLVSVLAIGVKRGNKLMIGKEQVDL